MQGCRNSRTGTGCFLVTVITMAFVAAIALVPVCVAEDRPPLFQVESDFEELWKKCKDCNNCVRFSRLELVGMDAGKKTANAHVHVVGDWTGLTGCKRVTSKACKGFDPKGGVLQKVPKTLHYRKVDGRWVFKGCK